MTQEQWEALQAFCQANTRMMEILEKDNQYIKDEPDRRTMLNLVRKLNERIQALDFET